jgi:hypothetical protein
MMAIYIDEQLPTLGNGSIKVAPTQLIIIIHIVLFSL